MVFFKDEQETPSSWEIPICQGKDPASFPPQSGLAALPGSTWGPLQPSAALAVALETDRTCGWGRAGQGAEPSVPGEEGDEGQTAPGLGRRLARKQSSLCTEPERDKSPGQRPEAQPITVQCRGVLAWDLGGEESSGPREMAAGLREGHRRLQATGHSSRRKSQT